MAGDGDQSNEAVTLGDIAIRLHTPVPYTDLHETREGPVIVRGILSKLLSEIPKS